MYLQIFNPVTGNATFSYACSTYGTITEIIEMLITDVSKHFNKHPSPSDILNIREAVRSKINFQREFALAI